MARFLPNFIKKKDPEPAPTADGGAAAGDGDGGADGGGGGGGDEDVEAEEGMVRDTKVVTEDAFYKIQAQKLEIPERGETSELQRHWARPRRWAVRLWNIQFNNATKPPEEMKIFLNFIIGGNTEEFKVRGEGGRSKEKIWVCGKEGKIVRTPVVYDVPGDDMAEDIHCDVSFEWRGSYLELESQLLRIEMWNWDRFRVNKFDSWHEDTLINYATGHIYNEIELVKVMGPGRKKTRANITFSLYFQEIYEFELNFEAWRAMGIYSAEHALKKLKKYDENGDVSSSDEEEESSSDGDSEGSDSDDESVDQEAAALTRHVYKSLHLTSPRNLQMWCRSLHMESVPIGGVNPSWGTMGKAYFRGTISDLYNGVVDVVVYTDEDYRQIGVTSKPSGLKGKNLPLGVASIPLTGCLEHGDLRATLKPASWFATGVGCDYVHKLRVGMVEGHIGVPNKPRFQQLDMMDSGFDKNKRYLYAKVQKVENVILPEDMPPNDEIGLFVEGTFDTVPRRTKVKKDVSDPTWNEEMKWELNLNRKGKRGKTSADAMVDTEATWEEIQSKGPVQFDLWTQGSVSNEHLGYCQVHLADCIQDDKGQPQKITEKVVEDRIKKISEKYEVRRFLGTKKMSFIYGPAGTGKKDTSTLHLEMWILPDLSPKAVLKKVKATSDLPKAVARNWDALQSEWDNKVAPLERFFPVTCLTQMQEEFFLPRFLDVIKPPKPVDTRNAVSHYIGCMPYIPKRNKVDFMAYTPEFFNEIRKGEALDHALLHCSFMLGLMQKAHVCIGTTLQHEPHAWVMTIEADGSIKFWEPFLSSGTYLLKDRLAHPEFVVGARPPKKLSAKEIGFEIDRRKRLQKLDKKTLVLKNSAVHEHEMAYGNVLTWVHAGVHCINCGRIGGDPGFQRGFYSTKEKSGICWSCADQFFLDRTELDSMIFDPRQPFHFEEENEVILPYRSVEVVFNNTNIWANLQNMNPAKIFWDFVNPIYWHQFAPNTNGLRPCFRGCHFPVGRDEAWKNRVKRAIQARVATSVRKARSAKNLHTTWVRNPALIGFLEAGLELRMNKEVCSDQEVPKLKERLEEWEQLLLAKTLDKYKTRGQPFFFNFSEPTLIADSVVEQCGFLETREKSSQFCLAVHLTCLPGEVVCVYIYLIETHLLQENDIKLELEKREEEANHTAEDDPQVLFAALQEANDKAGGKTLGDLLLASVENTKAANGGRLITADEVMVMTGFSETKHDEKVQVLDGGLTVEYNGEYEMYGGAIGDFPILATPDGKYFEVHINKTRLGSNLPDGLALGVTTRSPATIPEMPMSMDQITPCWLCGFNGAFNDGTQMVMVDWRPQYLKVGDHVGFLVAHPGECKVYVNGAQVASWSGDIPCDSPMYAVVDLIGMTQGVSLVQGAKPPTGTTPWVKVKNMKHFDRKKVGINVQLSDDGIVAKRKREEELFSVIIGDGPIPAVPHDPESLYYEVKVEEVTEGATDGMAIGVTSMAPSSIPGELPQTLDGLESVFAVGFDGQMYSSSSESWAALQWFSRDLKVGDRVGIFVSGTGQMSIFVNEFRVAEGPGDIPRGTEKPLYAVADLLGNTRSISYILGADCPVMETLLLPPGGAEVKKGVLEMTGFSQDIKGMNVRLSGDGLTAVYTGESGKELYGGLIANGILKKREEEECYYFEVRVDSVRRGHHEGLAIGVTTESPGTIGEGLGMPESLDELEEAFLVGFDGSEWDGSKLFWGGSPWTPSDLQRDDHVGVLIDINGVMSVYVNGDGVTQCSFTVPVDKPLYAIVDLIGATGGVTLLLGTKTPEMGEINVARRKREKFVPLLKDDPKHKKLPRPEEDMRGWSPAAMGKKLHLSPNTLTVKYIGGDNDLFGGVIGDGVVPQFSGGCYFEVEIDLVGTGAPDGFAIGVTDKSPEKVKKIPDTMDKFKKTWLVGYDGCCWDGKLKDSIEVNWYPSELKAGDRVGVFVGANSRNMFVYVNGKKRVDGPRKIPEGDLYPVVDLVGNTKAVTFIEGAQVPVEKKDKAAVLRGGFSRAAHGENVTLSGDGSMASHKEGNDLNGIVLTADPLVDVGHGRRYFEIVINKVDKGQPDGMAIGVTTRRPEEVRTMPSSADMLRPSWLVGFDGAWWDGPKFEWGVSDWHSRELNERDYVGVSVNGKGELSVTVNGNWVAGGPTNIPSEPLYGIVDLLGAIRSVGLVTDARPPGIQASAGTSKPKREVKNGGAPTMKGFNLAGHGKTVVVTPDGKKATRARIADESYQGVILGDGPIAMNPHGVLSFEFYIAATEKGASEDGLAVGVTTRSPAELRVLPETADQLDPSWLVGFDGACWDGATMSWDISPWNPSDMLVGDLVRVNITKKNELEVFVNRKKACSHHMNLPKDSTQMFALWDLNGNTAGISFTKPIMPEGGAKKKEAGFYGKEYMSAFDKVKSGSQIKISESGLDASRPNTAMDGCVLIGNYPLEPGKDGDVSFTISVTSVQIGPETGMAIGVTTRSPADLREPPTTAEAVDPSWLVGFDASTWDGETSQWGFCNWNPTELEIGDLVKVIVTGKAELKINVNGIQRCSHPMHMPQGADMYALVDLLGTTASVHLVISDSEKPQAHAATMNPGALGGGKSMDSGSTSAGSRRGSSSTDDPDRKKVVVFRNPDGRVLANPVL